MCIRDSLETFGIVLDECCELGLPCIVSDRGALAVRAGDGGPVSYTHLRAHETVLDLVCRLLLEKKKKKRIRHKIRLLTHQHHTMSDMSAQHCARPALNHM